MRTLLVLAIHLVTSIAKLLGPRGARGLLAETLLLKHQLLVMSRSRRNAGFYFEKFMPVALGSLRYSDWENTFQVNTLGPSRVTESLIEHIARSARRLVVVITSNMGSIARIESPGSYYYRSSKAALNAAMKGLSVELRPRGIGVLLLHPGWVQTRMGGAEANVTPTESVQGMRRLLERFSLADTGRFLRFDGTEMPW